MYRDFTALQAQRWTSGLLSLARSFRRSIIEQNQLIRRLERLAQLGQPEQ